MAAQGVMMSRWAVWVLGLVVAAHLVSVAHSDIKCTDLVPKVSPCARFVLGSGDKPSDACCAGAKIIDGIAAASQPDRKAICLCLKQAAAFLSINFDKVNQIPKLCHLTFNISISKDMDCDKI